MFTGVVVAALLLGRVHLCGHIPGLGLPLSQHLVKVLAALLGDDGGRVDLENENPSNSANYHFQKIRQTMQIIIYPVSYTHLTLPTKA